MHDISVSGSQEDKVSMAFFANRKEIWQKTKKLSDFRGRAGEFDLLFYVGGYGRESSTACIRAVSTIADLEVAMFDIVDSPTSAAIIQEFHAQKKLLGGI